MFAALLSGNAKGFIIAAVVVFVLAAFEGFVPRRGDRYYTPSVLAIGLALLAVAFIVNG
jgi:hypothetical protein